jgi:hypothetical protein
MDTTMAEAIERATVSPDPAVRSAAIHYRTLEQELQGLQAFFTLYGRAHTETAVKTLSAPKGRNLPGGKIGVEFIGQVRDLLLKRGEPLRMSRLYAAFYEAYPGQKKLDSEVFRQRLVRHKSLIRHVENVGYWPADMALPGESAPSNGAS